VEKIVSFTLEILTVCGNVIRVERENGLLSSYIWKTEWLCQTLNWRRSCKRKFRYQEHASRCVKNGGEKSFECYLISNKRGFKSKWEKKYDRSTVTWNKSYVFSLLIWKTRLYSVCALFEFGEMRAVISFCGRWCYSNSILHTTYTTEHAKILCWRLNQINAQWLDEFTVVVQSCALVRCKLCAELVKSCACRVTSSGVLAVLVVETQMWVNRRKTYVLWFCIWHFSCGGLTDVRFGTDFGMVNLNFLCQRKMHPFMDDLPAR
jgi:hypothetical protein